MKLTNTLGGASGNGNASMKFGNPNASKKLKLSDVRAMQLKLGIQNP